MTAKASMTPMLDTMKNALIGRVNYPHPYMMEKGAHAIPLVTHSPDVKFETTEERRMRSMIWIMEKLTRVTDQLDE